MSTGRMARLVQILGLQRLDMEGQDIQKFLPPVKDWVELEERRRTFWFAFFRDRFASSGTGCPMIIDEKEVGIESCSHEEASLTKYPIDRN